MDFIKAVTFDNPNLKKMAWVRYLFKNPGLSSLMRAKIAAHTVKHGLMIDDTDMTYALVSELKSLPFHLIEDKEDLTKDSPEIKKFVEEAEKCTHLPKKRKLDNIKYTSKVLDLIGLRLSQTGQPRLEDGSRVRQYKVEDKMCYHETDCEGKLIRDVILYPLLEPYLDRKSEELFDKYNVDFFEKVKTDFVGETKKSEVGKLELKLESALDSDTDLTEANDIEVLLNKAENKLQVPTVVNFKEEKTPTVSLVANRQEGTSVNQGTIRPLKQDKPEDKIIRTSYKRGNKTWKPGRVIRYLSAEGQELTGKYLGKAIGLIDVWLRDNASGNEIMISPEYCI